MAQAVGIRSGLGHGLPALRGVELPIHLLYVLRIAQQRCVDHLHEGTM